MVSNLEGDKTSEILMEALGPNLRKLLKQCPNNVFTKTTVLMITIQLVRNFFNFFSNFFTDKKTLNFAFFGLCT